MTTPPRPAPRRPALAPERPRWHQLPGLVARRDVTVPLLLEPETCDVEHPDYGRCAAIRNHGSEPLARPHGNRRGGWL